MRRKKQKRVVEKSSSKQELEQSVATLRRQLTKTEKALTKAKDRADRWRKEAKAQERSASRARARVEKLQQKREEASGPLDPVQAAVPIRGIAPSRPLTRPTAAEKVTRPDETWSVTQLRAEARARGLTGMSNKTKAQLLTALS